METIRRLKHASRRVPEAGLRLRRQMLLKMSGIPWNRTASILYAPKVTKQIVKLGKIADSRTITVENSEYGSNLEHHFATRNKIQIKDALIHTKSGNVFIKNEVSKSWELLVESSEWPVESRITFAKMPRMHREYLRLEGVFLNGLISSNYYHQMTEDIPSILAIHRGQKIIGRKRDSKRLMTFGLSDIYDVSDKEFVQVDRLDFLTKGNDVGYLHPHSKDVLIKQLKKYMNQKPTRNIYLSRLKMRRSIPNEKAVIQYLQSFDFEIIDAGNLSLEEQISLFSEAETVVAPHGAAITNMIFSKKAKLLELMPISRINRCFEWQSHICGHGYKVLFYEANVGIDLKRLDSAIKKMKQI